KASYASEVKSAYFAKQQITLHPIVAYYKDANYQLVLHALMYVSDDTCHDHHLVNHFTLSALEFLKAEPLIQSAYIYSPIKVGSYVRWTYSVGKRILSYNALPLTARPRNDTDSATAPHIRLTPTVRQHHRLKKGMRRKPGMSSVDSAVRLMPRQLVLLQQPSVVAIFEHADHLYTRWNKLKE
ncbi:hypothetical protein ElyMa_005981500, partial [Elysia marginata]